MTRLKSILPAFALIAAAAVGTFTVLVAAEAEHPPARNWPHKGVFGTFDRATLQRGFQVYAEVCSSCHSINFVAFRNLTDLGYSMDEVKAIAAEYEIEDGPNDEGEMFMRTARPSDYFPPPFVNEQAARAANNGALPPDLSLIVKAREGGEDYIYALLTGFEDEPPAGFELTEGMNYNPYFPGGQIAMTPPLFEDSVEYADGTPATVEQMASDVTTFLAWTAEPTLEARKRLGFKVMAFLLVLTVLLYFVNRKVWSKLKR